MFKFVTFLTLSRGFMLIPLAMLWLGNGPHKFWWVAFIFCLIALTDILDGHLARTHNVTSDFGAFADPLLDKIVSLTLFILIAYSQFFNPILLIALTMRDIGVDAMHTYAIQKGKVLPANSLGKTKLGFQWGMILLIIIYAASNAELLLTLAYTSGCIALIFGLASIPRYVQKLRTA